MKGERRYKESDKMSDLICGNYSLLLVMSRFGLSTGFGDKSVKEACRLSGVDHNTFLAVVNFIEAFPSCPAQDTRNLSLVSLMSYLRRAHSYFLDFNLPAIRAKLVDAIGGKDDVASLILRFYDDYVNEVREHMEYENKTVFKYVDDLLEARNPGNFRIGIFAKRHNQIDTKLTELQNIIIKYYPARENVNLLNAVLFDIYSCAADLESHCMVEDHLFVPAVREYEKEREKERNEKK